MKENKYIFEYFRYQLVPTKVAQLTIDNVPYTVESLKEKKNKFFSDILVKTTFKNRDVDLPFSLQYKENEIFVLLLGNNKAVEYIEDFEKKRIKSDPFSIVIIDNHPDKQIIAIRNDWRAFSGADTISRIIETTINKSLSYYNIEMHVEAISLPTGFWEAIHNSKDGVEKITFEIIKPNVSNISGAMHEDMKALIDKVNSHKTTITMEASKNGELVNINSDDNDLNGLADYTMQGGGRAVVKFKNKTSYDTRRHIQKQLYKTVLDLKNSTQEQLLGFANKVLGRTTNET